MESLPERGRSIAGEPEDQGTARGRSAIGTTHFHRTFEKPNPSPVLGRLGFPQDGPDANIQEEFYKLT